MLPLTSVETKPNSKEIREHVYAVCPDVVAAVEDIARDIVDAYAKLWTLFHGKHNPSFDVLA